MIVHTSHAVDIIQLKTVQLRRMYTMVKSSIKAYLLEESRMISIIPSTLNLLI